MPVDAALAEALLKHVFRTLLEERADDMAFFDERIEKGLIAKLIHARSRRAERCCSITAR